MYLARLGRQQDQERQHQQDDQLDPVSQAHVTPSYAQALMNPRNQNARRGQSPSASRRDAERNSDMEERPQTMGDYMAHQRQRGALPQPQNAATPAYSAAPRGYRTWYDEDLDHGDDTIPGYTSNPPSRRNTTAQPGPAFGDGSASVSAWDQEGGDGYPEEYYDTGRLPSYALGQSSHELGGHQIPQPTYQASVSNPFEGDIASAPPRVGGPDGTRISFRGDGKGICTPICLRHSDKENVEEKAFFLFNPDSTRYDNTVQIRVYYRKNQSVNDCLENRLLRLEGHKTVSDRLETIAQGIQPYVRMMTDFYFPATEIHLVTQPSGEVTFDAVEDYEVVPEHAMPKFPEVPATLENLPKAPLGALTKLATLKYEVDLVTWAEDPAGPPHEYAFKRTMTSSSILMELEALEALRQCQHTISVSALVVDTPRVGSTRIRGFLIPYHPAGDLGDLLERFAAAAAPGATMTAVSRAPLPLSWNTKLIWVHSLAKAVQAAHAKGIVHGDLKPDNVLLTNMTAAGQQSVKLMDWAPVGPSRNWAAPEYALDWFAYLNHALDLTRSGQDVPEYDFRTNMGVEIDVYGLGAMMWAIGEEKPGTGNLVLKDRKWEKSPKWFVQLAESCLQEKPAKRPSVSSILLKISSKKPALFFA